MRFFLSLTAGSVLFCLSKIDAESNISLFGRLEINAVGKRAAFSNWKEKEYDDIIYASCIGTTIAHAPLIASIFIIKYSFLFRNHVGFYQENSISNSQSSCKSRLRLNDCRTRPTLFTISSEWRRGNTFLENRCLIEKIWSFFSDWL